MILINTSMRYLIYFLFFPLTINSQTSMGIQNKMDSIFHAVFPEDEPGGAVLLVKNGEILYKKGFGIADMQTREPITTQTVFNIGSISKPFVAYGILKLAEEKKISLDDELHKYFPDFISPVIAKKVKLYHLLTHTSGLPDSRKTREQREFYLTAKDEENWAPIKETTALEFEPGTKYKYSNPAFNGLALVIEKVSGMKWQDYIRKLIFQPAGMTRSTITDGPHPETGVAHGYIREANGRYKELDYGEEPTFAAAGNGGVWSSVEELWMFEQAIQKHGFLSGQGINSSRTIFPFPAWQDSNPSRLGLSWFITKDNDSEMIGHTGSQGGFISDYCWYPDQKLFYVLLCNVPRPIREIRDRVMKAVQ